MRKKGEGRGRRSVKWAPQLGVGEEHGAFSLGESATEHWLCGPHVSSRKILFARTRATPAPRGPTVPDPHPALARPPLL